MDWVYFYQPAAHISNYTVRVETRLCGDRLPAFPCLLYCFYRNVQRGPWFAYVCVPLRTSHWLYLCTHKVHTTARRVAAEPTQFSGRVDRVSPVCYQLEVTWPLLCSTSGAILRHFRQCWDSETLFYTLQTRFSLLYVLVFPRSLHRSIITVLHLLLKLYSGFKNVCW